MELFDLTVIGGGPGGYLAAERASAAGLKTLLVEKNALGGVCLNEGCIPSKTYLKSAKIIRDCEKSENYAVAMDNCPHLQTTALKKRKDAIISALGMGVRGQLRKNKVKIAFGSGRITEKTENGYKVCVASAKAEENYETKKIIIAAGAHADLPPIDGLKQAYESGYAITSSEMFDLDSIPQSMIIVGGGVIGLEAAEFFSAVKCNVTVLEYTEKVAGKADDEVAQSIVNSLEKKNVRFVFGARVVKIGHKIVSYQKGCDLWTLNADKVLVCVGRKPNTDGVGIENIGVKVNAHGAIETDDNMRTTANGVYAVGDVNGKIMLAHAAYREAEVAVNDILNVPDKMDYSIIPSVIYLSPEIAEVGETEQSAKEKSVNYKVGKLPMSYSGRHMAENYSADGFCKLIIDCDNNVIIGAHVVAPYAGEIITIITSFIQLKTDISLIKKIVFPHPTVAEIIKDVLYTL